jgi:hypothetical protein
MLTGIIAPVSKRLLDLAHFDLRCNLVDLPPTHLLSPTL